MSWGKALQRKEQERPTGIVSSTGDAAPHSMVSRALAYVAKMPPAISGQGGHAATWAVARKCAADFGLNADQTLDVLREFNTRCEPPWSDRELAHKAKDAAEKARISNPIEDRHWQMPEEHRTIETTNEEPPEWMNDDEQLSLSDSSATGDGPQLGGRIEILDADAIFAELEPPDYLVDDLIVRGTITEIIAYGYSGKSWLAVNLTNSVGEGVPFLDRFPTKRGDALYVDWESGKYESRRRLKADAIARGLATPIMGVSLAAFPNVYFTDPDFLAQIERLCDGRALVVADTLKAGSRGIDENSSEMRTGIDHFHRACERTACAGVVLAHAKKITGNPTKVDPREVGRGSSAIFDAADTVLHITYTEGEPLAVQQTKSRCGKGVAPFLVEIKDTANGGVLVHALDLPKAASLPGSATFDADCDLVLAAVRATPGASQGVITEKVKKRPGTVKAALEVLAKHGAVTNSGTDKAQRWFAVVRGAE